MARDDLVAAQRRTLPARLAGALRERVRLSGPRRESLESLLARADVLCAASAGHRARARRCA